MFNEQVLENLTLDLLYELGYDYINHSEVEDSSAIILKKDFIQAIKKINTNVSDREIQEVLKSVENLNEKNNIGNNKKFTQYLQEGVPTHQHSKIKIIDFEQIENNSFKVSSDFRCNEKSVAQIDMVIFINGLPLVVIELKKRKEFLKRAYEQLKKYQEFSVPSLFHYNQFMIVTNGEQAKVGTITSSWDDFREWKKIEAGDETENIKTHETLFKGMLRKDRVLDILNHFMVWRENEKILAAYHQYFGVKRAIESIPKTGVIYHAPGSGKTLLSIFYSKNLLEKYKNASILVVTDRKELINQLFMAFSKCQESIHQNLQIIENELDMQKLRNLEPNRIFFMTIQQIMKQEGIVNKSNDIFIIIEDIQGIFSNIEKSKKVQEIFPNATCLAITSTPQKTNKENIFGDMIDKYDMLQSVTDHLTVPIVYEERRLETKLIEEQYEPINKQIIIEHPKRLEKMVKDIIQHYETIQNSSANKAMIVNNSIQEAQEVYDKLIALKPEWKNKVQLVVMTRREVAHKKLETEFKDMESEFKIAIVVDMWLTGMDIPGLGVIYINKLMKKHALMQAIARVNRPYKGKTAGLIVDYIGLKKELSEAIELYTVKDKIEIIENKKVKTLLIEKIESIKKIFSDVYKTYNIDIAITEKYEEMKAGAEFILENEERTDMFMKYSQEVKNMYLSCASILEENIKQESMFFIAIRAFILKIKGKEFDLKEINHKEAIILEQKMKEDKRIETLDEIRKIPQKNIAILLWKEKLKKAIHEIGDYNITLREKLSYELDEMEEKYKKRKTTDDVEQIVEELEKITNTIEEERNKANQYHLSLQEKAIFDVLLQEREVKETTEHQHFILLAKMLVETANYYMTKDWNLKKEVRARIKIELKKVLLKYNYPPLKIEKVAQIIVKQLEEWYKNEIEKS